MSRHRRPQRVRCAAFSLAAMSVIKCSGEDATVVDSAHPSTIEAIRPDAGGSRNVESSNGGGSAAPDAGVSQAPDATAGHEPSEVPPNPPEMPPNPPEVPPNPPEVPPNPPEMPVTPPAPPEMPPAPPVSPVVAPPTIPSVPTLPTAPTSYVGGGGGVAYPPVVDISFDGSTLFALDTTGCIRPTTADYAAIGDCRAAGFAEMTSLLALNLQLSLSIDTSSRFVADGAGGFYVAVSQYNAPDALVFVDLYGNVRARTEAFDLVNGEANIALSKSAGATEVFVLDRGPVGYRIQAFNQDLTPFREIAVDAALAAATPTNIFLDSNGAFYVLSSTEPKLARLTATGEIDPTFALSGFSVENELARPVDLEMSPDGFLIVADAGQYPREAALRLLDRNGALQATSFSTVPPFTFPGLRALAFAPDGTLLVYDTMSYAELPGNQGLFTFVRQP
jgi:hypothetical protein